jgi:hypothetical protein
MGDTSILVIPREGDDWIVKEEESQRERGHYPTRDAAVAVGRALSRRQKRSLVIHELDGDIHRLDARPQGWMHRLFKR